MNPAWSRTSTTSFPHASANSRGAAIVSSDDVDARTTSTTVITGAGLKKWIPQTLSGRCVAAATAATESVDVLVANTA